MDKLQQKEIKKIIIEIKREKRKQRAERYSQELLKLYAGTKVTP